MGMATYDYYDSGTSSSTTYVWRQWVTYSTTSTAVTSNDVWGSWQGTGTAYTSNDVTWYRWVETTPTIVVQQPIVQEVYQPIVEPPANKDWLKIEEKKRKAEQKALDLLLDLIGEEQTKIYRETGNLLVKGEKYDWLLERGGRVYRVEKDKVVQLCLHTTDRFKQPESDNVIALALHAKFIEKEMAKGNNIGEFKDFKIPKAAVM